MNNNSNNCGDCGTTCSECGRPWAICKQDGGCGCNKCKDIKFCEYGRMANGCIREKQPGCPMQAVIPSVTVESIEGIKNLADCLVHVSDINTTFYIDDKHRPIITWAGPIDIPGYDMEGNPNNYRDQIVTDTANQMAVIYDKSGNGYLFGLAENIDLQEQIDNKLDEMAEDGTLEEIITTYIQSNVAWTFDTVADMKAGSNLIAGSYARTLGYYRANDGGGALYKISDSESVNEWQEQLNNGLYANLIYDNVLHINQLGADNNGVTDSSTVINEALSFINSRWTNGIFDLDTLVFNGVYLINSQIEMSPFCKLTGDGYVTFKTNVQEGTSVFWIHYPDGVIPDSFAGKKLQYQYANLLDFPKGCLFKNVNGSRKTTAIELGEHTDVENKKNVSRFKLCNFSIENYAIALQYNTYDIYICNHERLQLEDNDVNVKFGTNGAGRANSGEHMFFDNCLFAGRGIGFLYETTGFDLEVVNSSIDFLDYVVTDPYANGYHKIAISTTHIEGCKHLLGTIGTPNLVNIINNHLIFHIDETGNNGEQLITLEDNLSNKTAEQLSNGVCNITDCYLTSELKSMYDPANMTFTPYMQVFFKDNQYQDFNARLFLTEGNFLKDALDGADTGAVTLARNSFFGKNNAFKIVNFIGFKPEGAIVQDDYGYTGHKSLQLVRDSSSDIPAINFETALLPVKKSIYYASLFAFNKKSGNAIRFYWYDKDGNELGETDSYVYSPTAPSADTWFMNHNCKKAVIPPEACYFKVVFYCINWQGNNNTDPEDTAYKLGGVIIN